MLMKQVTAIAFTLALAAAPAAFAADQKAPDSKPAPQPTKMSDAQLDNVTTNALVNAFVVDLVDVNNNQVAVAVPVNAAVAANVLGGATGAASMQQPGD